MAAKVIQLTAHLRREYRRQLKLRVQRESLIVEHMPWVENIAGQVKRMLPPQIPFADLVSSGYVGLVEAAGRWDPSKGHFQRFAYRRVRGAIIDAHKRRAYREELHDSLDATREFLGYLPARLDTDPNPLPDEECERREKMHILQRRMERSLSDDEQLVLAAALSGHPLGHIAMACDRPVAWARMRLNSAREKVSFAA